MRLTSATLAVAALSATPALASLVTYTYEGPDLTCDGGCEPLNLSGVNFAIDDADPRWGDGNIRFQFRIGALDYGDPTPYRIDQSIFYKDTGQTVQFTCETEDCAGYRPPSFFVEEPVMPSSEADASLFFNDIYHVEDHKSLLLDFTDGVLDVWRLLVNHQSDSEWNISSFNANGVCSGPYDCVTTDGLYWAADGPGTWTRTPPVAPIPLPAGGVLLLSAMASVFALRWKQAGAR
jgi:hypothetical protein